MIEKPSLDHLMEHERVFLSAMLDKEDDLFWGTTWYRLREGFLYVSSWWASEETQAHILVADYLTVDLIDAFYFVLDAEVKVGYRSGDMNSIVEMESIHAGFSRYGLAAPKFQIEGAVWDRMDALVDDWTIGLIPIPMSYPKLLCVSQDRYKPFHEWL